MLSPSTRFPRWNLCPLSPSENALRNCSCCAVSLLRRKRTYLILTGQGARRFLYSLAETFRCCSTQLSTHNIINRSAPSLDSLGIPMHQFACSFVAPAWGTSLLNRSASDFVVLWPRTERSETLGWPRLRVPQKVHKKTFRDRSRRNYLGVYLSPSRGTAVPCHWGTPW